METEKNKNEIMTPKLGLSCNLPNAMCDYTGSQPDVGADFPTM